MTNRGELIGVGLGPGDPELITLKALRVLQTAGIIAYFAKAGNQSHAHAIAAAHLRPDVPQLPLRPLLIFIDESGNEDLSPAPS